MQPATVSLLYPQTDQPSPLAIAEQRRDIYAVLAVRARGLCGGVFNLCDKFYMTLRFESSKT